MTDRFDLVVIGSGPAGEKAGAQAAYHGRSVAIVERDHRVGGSAVGNAGIPTKTLRETALYLSGFRRREVYGVAPDLDAQGMFEHLRLRTSEVVRRMEDSVRANIERHGIELIRGFGSFLSPNRLEVKRPDGSRRVLEADVFLIATGSRPQRPAGIDFDDPGVVDSTQILRLEGPVESVIVLGGGAVGCEYASILRAVGVEVTLVDRSARLLKFADGEISELLAATFEKSGMRVITDAGDPAVARGSTGMEVRLGGGEVLSARIVFVAAGRVGNIEGLRLEEAGVEVDDRGRVVVDETFRTGAKAIYAAGDVIGAPSLASVSMEQGRVAACYALGIDFKDSVDPLAPIGVYSIPEVAMVGLTEEEAAARGIDYEVGRGWFERNTRAVISGATEGLVKLLFRREDRRLLGVHILSDDASELVHIGQTLMQHSGSIDHFIHATFNVPTRSEAYKYAAYDGLERVGL